jgi:hypothetical protein
MKNKRFLTFFLSLFSLSLFSFYYKLLFIYIHKCDRSSDTGYGLDQHFIPFGKFPSVDVIVRARRDG